MCAKGLVMGLYDNLGDKLFYTRGILHNTRYQGTRQIPGYPGITQYPCYFFNKVRDTLFLSDNLNTTARAVDALHLHHKAGIQGWVPFPGVAACASHE